MDDIKIITAYCIITDTMHVLDHKSHPLAGVTDEEVLTVAVVAAMYFHNHHQLALCVMRGMRYITKPLSTSRFCRRLHALAAAGWLEYVLDIIAQLYSQGEVYVIDSVPVPVCKRVRAYRCRKIPPTHPYARHFFGGCAAKRWKFYGWRLHLVCTPQGVPVRFQMLPGAWHELTPIFYLTAGLPKGASVYADKGYVSAKVRRALRPSARRAEGVHLVAWAKKSMKRGNTFEEWCGLKRYRHTIETANSQLVNMGIQRLHARTNQGLAIKVLASLLALACINLD